MEPLIVILIFAGIGLLNWFLKKGGSKMNEMAEQIEQQRRQQSSSPTQRSGAESEEERMRKFFEALGLPPGSAPPKVQRPAQPPPLPARPATPRRPAFEARPESATRARRFTEPAQRRAQPPSLPSPPQQHETPAILQPRTAAAERSSAQPIFQAAEAIAASARATEQFPSGSLPAPASTQRKDLFAMLKSPGDIRNAIVLREILGAPRGLQSSIEPHTFPLS